VTARVGLLVPSSNTVMEGDFHAALPRDVAVVTGRMLLKSVDPDEELVMLSRYATPAAEAVGTAAPDVVVLGCTSASALLGEGEERQLCDRLAAAAGAPTISLMDAVREALERRAPRAVFVFTPYVDELTREVAGSIEAAGHAVAGAAGLGISENLRIGAIEPGELVPLAQKHVPESGADLVFVSCTNLRAFEAQAALQSALGAAVLTSNQAALEAVATRLGVSLRR
jgi:maleate isomerase